MSTFARRVEYHEARRHFQAGGRVLVSEYGHDLTQPVTPTTTVHSNTTTTWDELAATVAKWRNRYPNQRYYIIDNEPAVGTTVRAVRDGRIYATGTLTEVYDAPAGRMARIDEHVVSGPANLPTVAIVPVEDVSEIQR